MDALYGTHALGETAELVAEKYNVTREAQDAFALESQRRWGAAHAAGRFAAELVRRRAGRRRQARKRARGRRPRAASRSTSTRAPTPRPRPLAALRPAFRKERGTVTAGNSSGINDGAAAHAARLGERARQAGAGRAPLARIVANAVAGVEPRYMGIGPIPATRKALERAGIGAAKLDLVELNEAFAAQSIPCMTELGLDPAHRQRQRRRDRARAPARLFGRAPADHAGPRARAGAARATAWRRCASASARGSRPSSSEGDHEPKRRKSEATTTAHSDDPTGGQCARGRPRAGDRRPRDQERARPADDDAGALRAARGDGRCDRARGSALRARSGAAYRSAGQRSARHRAHRHRAVVAAARSGGPVRAGAGDGRDLPARARAACRVRPTGVAARAHRRRRTAQRRCSPTSSTMRPSTRPSARPSRCG